MEGLRFDGVQRISHVADLPEPRIEGPGDAVVAVRLAGLCGSDLHPYLGREPARTGVVPGHEVVGEVVEVGTDVHRIRPGQRVIVPFTTSCGACAACHRGLTARCERGQLFGWGDPDDLAAPALQGGQAELVRVPVADSTLVVAPADLDDEAALLLADNLPTGWYAVDRAGVDAGEAIVVVGLGAVGLCAVAAAHARGLGPVLGVDPVAARRAAASALGALVAHPEEVLGRVQALVPEGVGGVVDAAGTTAGQQLAASLLRPGGTLSVIAVPTSASFAVSPVEVYDRNLTLRSGRAPVRALLDVLLPLVVDGSLRVPVDEVLSHPDRPLADGPEVYRRFAAREDGLVKAAFRPAG